MADFAPLKSAEYTALTATPSQMQPAWKWGGKKRSMSASLTFTAAGATGTAPLMKLPAGKLRVLVDECRVVCPAGTSTADLHLGYAAHVSGTTGLAVVADDNAFLDNSDIGAGAIDSAFVLPAVGYLDLDSADGVIIEAMVDTANSPAAGELWVQITWVQSN